MAKTLEELALYIKKALDELEPKHKHGIKELSEEEICVWLELIERR